MNDPLNLSQTSAQSVATAQSILQNSLAQTQDTTTTSAAETVVTALTTGENLAAKKAQCVTDVTKNFFAGKDGNGEPVATTGLE